MPFAQIPTVPRYKMYTRYAILDHPLECDDLPDDLPAYATPEENEKHKFKCRWLQVTTDQEKRYNDEISVLQDFVNLNISIDSHMQKWINKHGLLTNPYYEPIEIFIKEHREFLCLYRLFDLTFNYRRNRNLIKDHIQIVPFNEYIKSLPQTNDKFSIPSVSNAFPPEMNIADWQDENSCVIIFDGQYFSDYDGKLASLINDHRESSMLLMEYLAYKIEDKLTHLKFTHTKVQFDAGEQSPPVSITPCISYPNMLSLLYWKLFTMTILIQDLERCKKKGCGNVFYPTNSRQIYCGNCGNARQSVYKDKLRAAVNEWKKTKNIEAAASGNKIKQQALINELIGRGLLEAGE